MDCEETTRAMAHYHPHMRVVPEQIDQPRHHHAPCISLSLSVTSPIPLSSSSAGPLAHRRRPSLSAPPFSSAIASLQPLPLGSGWRRLLRCGVAIMAAEGPSCSGAAWLHLGSSRGRRGCRGSSHHMVWHDGGTHLASSRTHLPLGFIGLHDLPSLLIFFLGVPSPFLL